MKTSPPSRLVYIGNCVIWPKRHVAALTDMCDTSRDITRATFLKRVGRPAVRALEVFLGYDRLGLTMKNDYHVQYRKSVLYGEVTYFLIWSGIEYVYGPVSLRDQLGDM